MKRFAVVIIAVLLAAAGPARAWCEATCLAATAHERQSATAHCPSHESSGATSLSGADTVNCRGVEAARTVPARLDLAVTPTAFTGYQTPQALSAVLTSHVRILAPVRLLVRPLRI